MDETLLSMGVYLVNSAHTQFGANRGGGGGGAYMVLYGYYLHESIQYCSTLIGVSKNLHKQCCFFIIWSRGSPRRISAEMKI